MARNNKRPPLRTLIILTVVSVGIALGVVEILLRAVDPYGLLRLQAENRVLQENRIALPQGEGYLIETGHYHVADNLNMTILGDGSRLVPHSNPSAGCTLVAIGDSMTFGTGVDESENWVNLWAMDTNHNIINAGRTATNAVEAASSIERYPADGHIWFFFWNDDQQTRQWSGGREVSSSPALWQYLRWQWLSGGGGERPADNDALIAAATEIHQQGAMIFTTETNHLVELLPDTIRDDIILIPSHRNVVSVLDQHPDAIGHQKIYDALALHLAEYADEVCSQPDETS